MVQFNLRSWMCGVTRPDNIRNERITGAMKVGEISNKVKQGGWSGHVMRREQRRNEGDGNDSTGEKEERKAKAKAVGQYDG